MVKHDAYNNITFEKLKKLLHTKIIIDGRNLFDPVKCISAGFVFRGVGKGKRVGISEFKFVDTQVKPLIQT